MVTLQNGLTKPYIEKVRDNKQLKKNIQYKNWITQEYNISLQQAQQDKI